MCMIKNGYNIIYSEVYEKFQVWNCNRCLEEFDDINEAIRFAEEN